MTHRTKIWIFVGLLALVAAVVLVLNPSPKSALDAKFVRYTDGGSPVIAFTNNGRYRGFLSSAASNVVLLPEFERIKDWQDWRRNLFIMLQPQDGQELLARAVSPSSKPLIWPARPSTISVYWRPFPDRQSKDLRQRLVVLLSKVGINIVSTGFVATVTLPPRPATPSLGPTSQPAP